MSTTDIDSRSVDLSPVPASWSGAVAHEAINPPEPRGDHGRSANTLGGSRDQSDDEILGLKRFFTNFTENGHAESEDGVGPLIGWGLH